MSNSQNHWKQFLNFKKNKIILHYLQQVSVCSLWLWVQSEHSKPHPLVWLQVTLGFHQLDAPTVANAYHLSTDERGFPSCACFTPLSIVCPGENGQFLSSKCKFSLAWCRGVWGGKAVTGRAEEGVEEVCGGQREAGQVHWVSQWALVMTAGPCR